LSANVILSKAVILSAAKNLLFPEIGKNQALRRQSFSE
jgi:hypothetical protein